MDDVLFSLLSFGILIYSVVLHEVAHGLMARSMGDRTAEQLGRLTLNPLKHLDPIGSVLLPLIMYLSRSPFLFGYAKPVPYDPSALNDRRWGPTKVGLAGPLTNLVLATIAGLVLRYGGIDPASVAWQLTAYVVLINLGLALFNLLPIPPLDGHWLLMAILPASAYPLKVALYRHQMIFLILVIFVVFPLLVPLISTLFRLLTGVPLL